MNKLNTLIKDALRRMLRALTHSPETPHETAKAFAVGVFIGVLPGLGTVVALLAAIAFRLNTAAVVLGSFVTNPWTVAFIYAGSCKLGQGVLSYEDPVRWKTLLMFETGWRTEFCRIAPALVVGSPLVALGLALVFYGAVRGLLFFYHRLRDPRPLP